MDSCVKGGQGGQSLMSDFSCNPRIVDSSLELTAIITLTVYFSIQLEIYSEIWSRLHISQAMTLQH